MVEVLATAVVGGLGLAAGSTAAVLVGGLVQLGVGLAVSQLGQALAGAPDRPRSAGIRTEVTLEGGTLPQTLLLGRACTAGALVAPFYSNGEVDDVPNAYRYAIIDLSDHPVTALRALFVDGQRFDIVGTGSFAGQTISVAGETLDSVPNLVVDGGSTAALWAGGGNAAAYPDPAQFPRWHGEDEPESGLGFDTARLAVWFKGGGQTAALPRLTSRFDDHPERPWTEAMVGRGVAYLVLRYRYDPDLFQGNPQIKAEVLGARLYDRRRDGTAGGSGPQRADDPGTWALSLNPVVMIEAILRGIPLGDGTIWGLGVDAADLPAAVWTTAADHCDELVDGVPRYRAGYEARMATAEHGGDEPFDVADELLKACAASVADCGGTWIVRAGPPALPLAYISDDDVVVSRPQDFEPHRGLTDVYNAVRATHPWPRQDWAATEAPLRRDAAAEAQDGERLIADLQLPAVWDPGQVQRLQAALLKDARRMRRHTLTLPPQYSGLLPLDTIAWTSARNGYEDKLFEIAEVAIEPATLAVTLALREVDPADYDWSPVDALPSPVASPGRVVVDPGPLPGYGVEAVTVTDALGRARRPGILQTWPPRIAAVRDIAWQIRVKATGAMASQGSTSDIREGRALVSEGLLPATGYEVRAKGDRTRWTPWYDVTTPAVGLTRDDLGGALDQVLVELEDVSDELLERSDRLLALTDELIEDMRLDELRADDTLKDVAEARLEALLYAKRSRDGQKADFAFAREESHALVTTEREAIARTRTELGAAIDDNRAWSLQERQVRVSAERAIALSVDELEVEVGEAQAYSTETRVIVADELEAQATVVSALGVQVGQAQAHSTQTRVLLANETSARGTAVDALEGQIGDVQAHATQTRTLVVNETSARVAAVQEVNARAGDIEQAASVTTAAVATLEGHAASSVVLRAGSGELSLVSASDPGGPERTGIFLKAKYTRIDGTTYIEDAVLTRAKVADEQIVANRAVSYAPSSPRYGETEFSLRTWTWSIPFTGRYFILLDVDLTGLYDEDMVFMWRLLMDGAELRRLEANGLTAAARDIMSWNGTINASAGRNFEVRARTVWGGSTPGIVRLQGFCLGASGK